MTTTEPPPPSGGDEVAPVNIIEKKIKRAERFGVPVQLSEEEKRNSRAERFVTTCGPEASKSSEELKKKARAERFGIVQAPSANEESKKKARLERFGAAVAMTDSLEEEKKKQEPSGLQSLNLIRKHDKMAEDPFRRYVQLDTLLKELYEDTG